ncbi:MAG: Ferredoxin [Herbinix sp.]|jgi:ferredoxin|nr:Ferredoxin [Herbinix sp.]
MRKYPKSKEIEIVYFSGTGGTKRAADAFVNEFTEQGLSVHCHEIHAKKPYNPKANDMLLILYPVYAMNAPRPVYEFIDKLPMVEKKLAAVISISGGGEVIPNTASRLHCIQHLKRRGYRIAYEQMLIMPANFIVSTPKELSFMLLKVLPEKVKKITTDLLSGVVRRTEPYLVDRIISVFTEAQKEGSKLYGRGIKVNSSCNGCGLCARSCPTDNIKLQDGLAVYSYRCCLCLRCIYDCPTKALQPSIGRQFILKGGFSLKELEKELPHYQPIDIHTYAYGAGFAGLKKYFMEG